MDSISDMLTIIRNGLLVKKDTVSIPFSNLKYEIAKILKREGFIERVEKKLKRISNRLYSRAKRKTFIEIDLKYLDGLPVISGLKRVSKPGQRFYLGWKKIKRVKGGYGIAIISTSKGLMTDREARKQRLGGEVLCEVW